MPHYYFNCEGAQSFHDGEGVDLPDLAAARIQAIRNASEVLRDYPEAFAEEPRWRMHVSDESGQVVFGIALVPSYEQEARG